MFYVLAYWNTSVDGIAMTNCSVALETFQSTIQNSYFYKNTYGIKAASNHTIIRNCTFSDISTAAIQSGPSSALVEIYDSSFYRCGTVGSSSYAVYMNQGTLYGNGNLFQDNIGNAISSPFEGIVMIYNSSFINNTGPNGAIYLSGNRDTDPNIISSCSFISNNNTSTSNGGGAIISSWQVTHIINCTFVDNFSRTFGGAISHREVDNSGRPRLLVIDSNFTHNTATTSGGAISCSSNCTIINCHFNGNIGVYGGAVHGRRKNIFSSRFINNQATSGGALHAGSTQDIIVNSTFEGNTATNGGAIFLESSSNSILMYKRYITVKLI